MRIVEVDDALSMAEQISFKLPTTGVAPVVNYVPEADLLKTGDRLSFHDR
jgi:hypothetical protein